MKKLSTGQDSTLGTWLYMVETFFSKDGKASEFIRKKIKESTNGEKEEVIADEQQFLSVLSEIELNKKGDK